MPRSKRKRDVRWWARNVVVPLIGTGGVVALIAQFTRPESPVGPDSAAAAQIHTLNTEGGQSPALINTGNDVTITFHAPPDIVLTPIKDRLDQIQSDMQKLRPAEEIPPQSLPEKAQERLMKEVERLLDLGFTAVPGTSYRAEAPSVQRFDMPIMKGMQYAFLVGGNAAIGRLRGYAMDELGKPLAASEVGGRQFTMMITAGYTGTLTLLVEIVDVDDIGQVNFLTMSGNP
jgi:hypothetical protein